MALDAAGDVFVTDYGTKSVKEIVAVNGVVSSSSQVITLSSSFSAPEGVAVDAAGDVFVADNGSAVKEIVAVSGVISSSPTIKMLGSGFSFPADVVVDGAGMSSSRIMAPSR